MQVSFNQQPYLKSAEIKLPEQIAFSPVKLTFKGSLQSDTLNISLSSLDRQIDNFMKWVDKKIKDVEKDTGEWKIYVPEVTQASKPTPAEQIRNDKAIKLFKEHFKTFLWTGEECSDPSVVLENGQSKRWDELAMINFYDPVSRAEHIQEMKKLGISNIRLGVPNSKFGSDKDWKTFGKDFGEALKDFHKAGIKISLDFQHFGLPDKFKNDKDPSKSYFLNPAWPDYHADLTKKVMEKYADSINAITLINEPMITNSFSGGIWNEKLPGWGDDKKDFDHYAIERGCLIAKAAIKSKMVVEKYMNRHPEAGRKVYVHNEAIDHKIDNHNSNTYFRFMTSDLMLGHDWLTTGDYKQTDMFKWMKEQYVRNEFTDKFGKPVTDEKEIKKLQEKDYNNLVNMLNEVKQLHEKLYKTTGKTMLDDTVFGVDYYIHNESGKGISHEPKNYGKQREVGIFKGLYGVTKDYWDRYHLPILHTETNMWADSQSKWGLQELIELGQLKKAGIPVLGFNWYSLMDQFGWDKGLNCDPDNCKQCDIGLLNPVKNSAGEYEKREFTRNLLPEVVKAVEGII